VIPVVYESNIVLPYFIYTSKLDVVVVEEGFLKLKMARSKNYMLFDTDTVVTNLPFD
jgi:hypothetical protein